MHAWQLAAGRWPPGRMMHNIDGKYTSGNSRAYKKQVGRESVRKRLNLAYYTVKVCSSLSAAICKTNTHVKIDKSTDKCEYKYEKYVM